MKSGRYLQRLVTVELTGAEPEKTLHILNQAGIRIFRICWLDPLTVRFCCAPGDCGKIREQCAKRGESVKFDSEFGGRFWKKAVLSRPVLVTGSILLLILTFFLPTRVLFFRVEGNQRIPSRQILEVMEECGIRFGASRQEVRSEKMKNVLLEAMPELKWAGINTTGCTSVVSVREREQEPGQKKITGITGIVAAADGYITSCTVVRGTGLCEPGQIVKAGQLLISGYADRGLCIQATGAEGEIFAETSRRIEVISPVQCLQRVGELVRSRRLSLVIGKKRINLWKDSRIWDATCGRMYEEYYLTLPGGFRLPVCLGVETLTSWQTAESEWDARHMETDLMDHARRTVLEQTIAGTILGEEQSFFRKNGVYGISSRFLCSEMIGRVITQEIGDTNGKTD